jgi:UDP-glucose 4-epimerase
VSEHHLILGGAGFIGRHVALMLARAGHRVTIADRVPRSDVFPKDIADAIAWRLFDRSSVDWDVLVADATVVHDYAWSSVPASANANPAADLVTNLSAVLGLLEALRRRGEGRMVFSSSGGTVYGKLQHTPVQEDHPLWPVTAYGAGKATAEIYVGLYRKMHGVDCRIARTSNAYGAGQNLAGGVGAITAFLYKAMQNEPIVIWGDGEIVRDYIHIADVASCLVALARAPRIEQPFVFNVGTGTGTSLNTIVAEIEAVFQRKLDVRYVQARAFDVPINVLAIDRTREILGWKPRVSVREGIKLTLADLSSHEHFSTLAATNPTAGPCSSLED